MKLTDFIAAMETIAPPEFALSFDNPGLLVGTEKTEINKVLVALDCTVETVKEAVAWGADLVLTHHPLFFEPVKHILPYEAKTAAAYRLIRSGIAMYAAHTNLDAAVGGVNDVLCERLSVENQEPLPPEMLGRIGSLPAPMPFGEFAVLVKERLSASVRTVGDRSKPIRRIALIGGSGGGDVQAAKAAGADVLVTGEIRHHQALEAEFLDICAIEAGHYETEVVVLEKLISHLQKYNSKVQYKLAQSQSAPLIGV